MKSPAPRSAAFCILALLILLVPSSARAQRRAAQTPDACVVALSTPAQTLRGSVRDAQGARIAGASVTATCEAVTCRTTAGADGAFELQLPAAACDLRITHPGFREVVHRVRLGTAGAQEIAVTLPVDPLTESVTVRAEPVSRAGSIATRTSTPLIETPQSISVVSADEVRDQASPTLQEAVRYVPGVRHALYGIDNRGDWISLRGSQESTTLLDGMRLPLTGWYGVVRNEPYLLERIEVLRGPSSIIVGQNDPGGVVNLATKRPEARASREIGVTLGNYARREIRADLTGPLDESGSLLYRVVALGRDSDTQVDHADEQRLLLAPALTWRPHPRGSVTVFGEYQYDRSKNTNAFLGLAGTLHEAPNGPIPTKLFIGEPAWDRYGGTRWRMGYTADAEVGGAWQLRHQLRHDRVDGRMESMYAAWWNGFVDAGGATDPNGEYLGRQWYIYDDRSRVTAGELLLEGVARTGAIAHRLLVGADGMLHDASQAYADGEASPLNVYDPVYGGFARPSLGSEPATENAIRRAGLLVQDQMKVFERLSVRLGVRRDYIRNAVIGGDVQRDWATSGNAGIVFELWPGVAPYGSYSESFNPVAGTDAAGRAYEPRRGRQIEAGLKVETQGGLQASASVYALEETNRLVTDPANVGFSIQIGEARTRGVELEVRGTFGSWSTLAGYSYTRARATAAAWGGDLDPDQQLEGIPEHTASAWVVHEFRAGAFRGFRAGGGVRFAGRIGDGTGRVFVPAVTLLDAMASYEVGRWRLALNLNNLTDRTYLATCLARGDCWFGARRAATLTAAVRY